MRRVGANKKKTRSGIFVAINFWDVVCLLLIAAIFEFGVVAISRHGGQGFLFAFRSLFAVTVAEERSLGSRWSLSGCRFSTDRHFFFAFRFGFATGG